jgi:hypothetical protein
VGEGAAGLENGALAGGEGEGDREGAAGGLVRHGKRLAFLDTLLDVGDLQGVALGEVVVLGRIDELEREDAPGGLERDVVALLAFSERRRGHLVGERTLPALSGSRGRGATERPPSGVTASWATGRGGRLAMSALPGG